MRRTTAGYSARFAVRVNGRTSRPCLMNYAVELRRRLTARGYSAQIVRADFEAGNRKIGRVKSLRRHDHGGTLTLDIP